jgi:hypothetical protein
MEVSATQPNLPIVITFCHVSARPALENEHAGILFGGRIKTLARALRFSCVTEPCYVIAIPSPIEPTHERPS